VCDPFLHAKYTETPLLGGLESYAIICDHQVKRLLPLFKPDLHARRARVASRIEQRFLHHPVDTCSTFFRQIVLHVGR
jgi:hypothetical protein